MRRREFIALTACAAWPRVASAQAAVRPLRVGVVSAANSRTTTFWTAFLERMKDHGYIEGHNFALDFTNLGGHLDRYPDETAKLVERGVDIIIASGVELGLKSAVGVTKTVPIIMIAADYDPLALGYVSNLARPGGNLTGLMFQQLEQTEKRIQLLRDAFPDVKSATVLWDRISADQWRVAQQVAPKLGLKLVGIELGAQQNDYNFVLGQAPHEHRRALVVLMTPALFPNRAKLAEAAIRRQMASIAGLRAYAEAGALLSYGPSIDKVFARVADYVDRIVKGARAGELPIEQPTRFELVINTRTAKALALELPPTFLARADEVIE